MWETVKNISALLGLVALVIGLVRLYRNTLRLKATGERTTFIPLPETEKQIYEYRHLLLKLEKSGELKEPALHELIDKLPQNIFADFGDASVFYLDNCWVFKVSNAGKSEIKDPHLELPFKGIYTTDEPGGDNPKPFDKKIVLNTMRSKANVQVTAWTHDSFLLDSSRSTFRVTHSTDSVPVRVGRVAFKRPAQALEDFGVIGILFMVCITLICITPTVQLVVRIVSPSATSTTRPAVSLPTTQPSQ